MRIVEQSTNKLILRNPGLGAWIFGGMITSLAIILPLVFIGKTTNIFSCQRKSNNLGTCKVEEISKWGEKAPKFFLVNELQGARVETKVSYNRNGRSTTTYQVYISSNHQDIYFINGSSTYTESIVEKINQFVSNETEPSLEIKTISDNSIVMYIIGGILGLIGFCLIFADDITCSFDQSSGTFYIRKQGIRGKRFKSDRNSHISDIRIEENGRFYNKTTGKTRIIYKLSLFLKSGETLLLDSGSDRETYQKIEQEIRKLINL